MSKLIKDDTTGKITLTLGDIDIGLEDVLELRDGMEIACEIPQEYSAKLFYAGKVYADVAIKTQAGAMQILIKKVNFTEVDEAA